ncbi:hypothetical protein DPEC_G00014330 [Dallia pectoralis]|uniref:Uncharacterized protein n=1 Tax=Dallia pectoralis TaxID=75939 RepID=A0ACC2HMS4_DALPE|nr:hypothetical protein DPEC_G00014330 [Dallia pectoralis]
MTEDQVECVFSQIALAFRSDQFTLQQRLLTEEHARNLSEDNIHLELFRGRETLETLKVLCLDSKRSKILQKLELCLDIIEGTIERVSSTAEVLGAVHQEARVSRAMDLMFSHVENLRSCHERNGTQLDDTKNIQDKGSRRILRDPEDGKFKERSSKISQQLHFGVSRRRVSVELITKQVQEKRKRARVLHRSLSLNNVLGENVCPQTQSKPCVTEKTTLVDDRIPKPAAVWSPPGPARSPARISVSRSVYTNKPNKVVTKQTSSTSSSMEPLLRIRRRGKAALERTDRRKDDQEKTKSMSSIKRKPGPCGLICRERPLAHWHRYWLNLVVALSCVVILIFLLWLVPELLL